MINESSSALSDFAFALENILKYGLKTSMFMCACVCDVCNVCDVCDVCMCDVCECVMYVCVCCMCVCMHVCACVFICDERVVRVAVCMRVRVFLYLL